MENNNFWICVVLALMLGAMIYAMGYMADRQIERMQEQQELRELTALITDYRQIDK